jgi:hypothetical protein
MHLMTGKWTKMNHLRKIAVAMGRLMMRVVTATPVGALHTRQMLISHANHSLSRKEPGHE